MDLKIDVEPPPGTEGADAGAAAGPGLPHLLLPQGALDWCLHSLAAGAMLLGLMTATLGGSPAAGAWLAGVAAGALVLRAVVVWIVRKVRSIAAGAAKTVAYLGDKIS